MSEWVRKHYEELCDKHSIGRPYAYLAIFGEGDEVVDITDHVRLANEHFSERYLDPNDPITKYGKRLADAMERHPGITPFIIYVRLREDQKAPSPLL